MAITASVKTAIANPRIMVVDDDPLITELMDIVFGIHIPEGTVTLAHDAEHALTQIGQAEFDILITDINMPGMSGIELVERIRSENPEFRIVVHSGSRSDEIQALPSDIPVVEKGSSIKSIVEAVMRVLE